jgi:hypothetical protein
VEVAREVCQVTRVEGRVSREGLTCDGVRFRVSGFRFQIKSCDEQIEDPDT